VKRYLGDMIASNSEKKDPPPHLFERSKSGLAAEALALHGIPDALSSKNDNQHGNNTVSILSLGVHGQGLALHQHAQTWLSLMRGRKLWYFMAPDALQNHEAYEAFALELPKSWPKSIYSAYAANRIHVCEQLPGDVVHVPALWHHATQNDGDTLGVGMQSSELDDASLERHSRSAFVKDLRAQNSIVEMEAKKPVNWEKKTTNALRAIDNAIGVEPLNFGRRSNAVLARARVARLEGKNSTDVVLVLFKEWAKIERFANQTYSEGVLSPAQFAAVVASLIENIERAVPQELQNVGKDVVDYLVRTGETVDRATFESFQPRE
jgi:hypothetical protein